MEGETFMKTVSFMCSLLGAGATLRSIFSNTSAPSVQDIVKGVSNEVRAIFQAEKASGDMLDAAIALKLTRNWLKQDYQVQKDAVVAPAKREKHLETLYNDLTYGTDHEGIGQLEARREHMLNWAGGDVKSAVSQATSLYLGISLFICLLYRERSEVRSDPAETEGDLASMRIKAKDEFEACKPRFDKIVRTRLASVKLDAFGFPAYGAALTDAWLTGFDGMLYVIGGRPSDVAGVVRAYHAYLATGSEDDLAVLNAELDKVPDKAHDDRDRFRNKAVPAATSFAKWVADGRVALWSLHQISGEPHPTTQDGWFWCERCGVLHYSAGRNWCHKDGLPHSVKSENYQLHLVPPTEPTKSQANWHWCRKCGTLHYERDASDPSVCPAGNNRARHDTADSANYSVVVGDTTHQTGWRWCRKCGALHHDGTGVCPAGGRHDATGSGHYAAEPVTDT